MEANRSKMDSYNRLLLYEARSIFTALRTEPG